VLKWRRNEPSGIVKRREGLSGEQVEGLLTKEGAGREMPRSCSWLKEIGTDTGEPVAMKVARRVREGEVRKGLARIPPEGISGGSRRQTVPRWPPSFVFKHPLKGLSCSEWSE
jgi:hypothetical protein